MSITTSLQPTTQFRNTYPVIVMTTGVNAVTPGGNAAGWVSGVATNLPISTTANIYFDLGPDWSLYSEIGLMINPGWTAGSITYNCAGVDSITPTVSRRLLGLTGTTCFYTSTAVTVLGGFSRPAGRYVIIQAQSNGTGTTDGTGLITITAYPGV